jgi:hypothetical protein
MMHPAVCMRPWAEAERRSALSAKGAAVKSLEAAVRAKEEALSTSCATVRRCRLTLSNPC